MTVRLWFNVSNTAAERVKHQPDTAARASRDGFEHQYASTDADNDVCNVSVSCAWFKNGGLNSSITGPTFKSGNVTTGDQITGNIRFYDRNLNSSWRNTSGDTVRDTTLPVLSAVNVSPTSTTTDGTEKIAANCTTTTPSGLSARDHGGPECTGANSSMANTGGATYSYDYRRL